MCVATSPADLLTVEAISSSPLGLSVAVRFFGLFAGVISFHLFGVTAEPRSLSLQAAPSPTFTMKIRTSGKVEELYSERL